VIKINGKNEYDVSFFDSHKSSFFNNKAYHIQFPSIQKAVEFISLRSAELSIEEIDLNPVLLDQEFIGKSNIQPLTEKERVAILLDNFFIKKETKKHLFLTQKILPTFKKQCLYYYQDFIKRLTPIHLYISLLECIGDIDRDDNSITDYFCEKYPIEMQEITLLGKQNFIQKYGEKETNFGLFTIQDTIDTLQQYQNMKMSKMENEFFKEEQDFDKLTKRIMSMPHSLRKMFFHFYMGSVLRKDFYAQNLNEIKNEINLMSKKLDSDKINYQNQSINLRSERYEELFDFKRHIEKMKKYKTEGLLDKENLAFLQEIEGLFLKTLIKYLETVLPILEKSQQPHSLKEEIEKASCVNQELKNEKSKLNAQDIEINQAFSTRLENLIQLISPKEHSKRETVLQ
jgi:hypothetical protein